MKNTALTSLLKVARNLTNAEVLSLTASDAAELTKLLLDHDHDGESAPFDSDAARLFRVWSGLQPCKGNLGWSQHRLTCRQHALGRQDLASWGQGVCRRSAKGV